MKSKKNLEGLRQNAQKKRQETLKKAEIGIQQLLKAGEPVDFATVANVAGVSKAWLYKEPEIKAQIKLLRQRSHPNQSMIETRTRRTSELATNQILLKRIKKLELENDRLKKRLELFSLQYLAKDCSQAS